MCCVVFRHCHQLANGAFHQHQSSVAIVHAMSIIQTAYPVHPGGTNWNVQRWSVQRCVR